MRTCLFLCLSFLLLLSSSAFASRVKCFSSGVKFYDKTVKDVYIGEGFVIIRHPKSNEVIMADCIVRYRTKAHK